MQLNWKQWTVHAFLFSKFGFHRELPLVSSLDRLSSIQVLVEIAAEAVFLTYLSSPEMMWMLIL
jgi:hypothetical protein